MSTPKKKPTPKKATAKPAPKKPAPRADYGKPIDAFFAKQSPELRKLLEGLRAIVEKTAPDATSSIKWGMPFYSIGSVMMCALGAHKSHVNLMLAGPPGTFSDPDGLLTGTGKTGQHFKLDPGDAIPTAKLGEWVKTAATLARRA